MTGVSILLRYSLHQAEATIAEKNTTIAEQDTTIKELKWGTENISWKISYKDKKPVLEIKGRINQSEEKLDKFCILSIVGKREFYLNGNEREDKNICKEPFIPNLEKDGIWRLKKLFNYDDNRTIRVQKIYKNSLPKSYIYFTIEKNNN